MPHVLVPSNPLVKSSGLTTTKPLPAWSNMTSDGLSPISSETYALGFMASAL